MTGQNNGESRLDQIDRILAGTVALQKQAAAGSAAYRKQIDEESAAHKREIAAYQQETSAHLRELGARMEVLHVNIESLHASVSELHGRTQDLETASRRHESLIAQVLEAARRDGENIAALARIAQMRERRIGDLEGGAS